MTDLTQQDSKQYGRPDDAKIIPFMKIAKPAAIFSILLTIVSIFFIATKGLNLGLDFTGGVSAELNYAQAVQPAHISCKIRWSYRKYECPQGGISSD